MMPYLDSRRHRYGLGNYIERTNLDDIAITNKQPLPPSVHQQILDFLKPYDLTNMMQASNIEDFVNLGDIDEDSNY